MSAFLVAAGTLGLLAWLGLVRARWAGPAAPRPSWPLMAGVACLLAAVGAGGYLAVGSPQRLADDPAAVPGAGPWGEAIRQLQHELAAHPDEVRLWVLLARAYAAAGEPVPAAQALQRARALRPRDAGLLADHADFLARLQGSRLDGEPMRLVQQALALDPDQPQALALAGAAAYARRDFVQAARHWERLAALRADDAALAQPLRERAAQARQLAAARGDGPPPASRP